MPMQCKQSTTTVTESTRLENGAARKSRHVGPAGDRRKTDPAGAKSVAQPRLFPAPDCFAWCSSVATPCRDSRGAGGIVTGFLAISSFKTPARHLPQHFLNFLPLPHGHGSLRPIFGGAR